MTRTKQTAMIEYQAARKRALEKKEEELNRQLQQDLKAVPVSDLKRLKRKSDDMPALMPYEALPAKEPTEESDGESDDSKCPDCKCENYPDCCYIDSDDEPGDACDTCIDGATGAHKKLSGDDDDDASDETDF